MFLFSAVICQLFRCVKTSLTYVRLFSRSYPIAVHIELERKYTHFVRVFTLQGQFVLGKRKGAIHILWLYKIYFSYFVYPFWCELRLLIC